MQKLIRHLAVTSASSLVVGLAVIEANPALAASFDFSYTFTSGQILSGMIDGDLQPNGNTVANLSNLMAIYSGTSEVFDRIVPGSTMSLNGLSSIFFAFEVTGVSSSFVDTNGVFMVLESGSFLENETFTASRWSLIEKVTPTPVTTPEPGFIAGLAVLCTVGLGNFLSKKKG